MASAKKPTDGKKKNPCPPPPKGKPPRKATGITIDEIDEIGEDMKREGSPAMLGEKLTEIAEGKGQSLVREELSNRDTTWEDGEETLECQLTPEEVQRLEKQAIHLVGKIEQKKAQIASTQSMLAGERKALELQLSNLSRMAREGKEQRVVKTRTYMDYRRCTVYTERLDTHEEIRSRAMIGEELNMPLSVGGKTFDDLSKRPLEDTTTVCE